MSQTTIEIGKRAPAFELRNQDDVPTKLEDYRGRWVVLYFYPKDDTPGCTTEACDFTNGLADFEKLDAVILGCSPDSPESHRKFIEKFKLRVQLLSDPDRGVLVQYGAWGQKNMYGKITEGVIRSTVLIDPEGNAAHRWAKVTANGHAEQVRKRLEDLRKNRSAA